MQGKTLRRNIGDGRLHCLIKIGSYLFHDFLPTLNIGNDCLLNLKTVIRFQRFDDNSATVYIILAIFSKRREQILLKWRSDNAFFGDETGDQVIRSDVKSRISGGNIFRCNRS